MAQEQQAPAKPSLIARVFGSRIAQAIGVFGVAFTLFQGLEPFLKFSRFMAYLVDHWRELTRGLWSWLASLVHLDFPTWLDFITLLLFIFLITVRGFRLAAKREGLPWSILDLLGDKLVTLAGFVHLLLGGTVIATAIFLSLHLYIEASFASVAAIVLSIMYVLVILSIDDFGKFGGDRLSAIFIVSERAMLVLVGLLALNYISLHSHTIEAFIEKATR